jgi:molybdopterin molybdotransferase
MSEFLTLRSPDEAKELWLNHLPESKLRSEMVDLKDALGRVLAQSVIAHEPVPAFNRSSVDGYALKARDTHGTSESLPGYLRVVGEVPMGDVPSFSIDPGTCAVIHTGGMLPEGADAVVMIEYVQAARKSEIEVHRAVSVNENVVRTGEDVTVGEVVLPAGLRLRPADIGGLAALGIDRVEVVSRLRIGIISSGDEVVPILSTLKPGQVRDVNSYSIGALVARLGGQPANLGILPDNPNQFSDRLSRSLADNDVLIVSAGSSASVRDLTFSSIQQLGQPGVLVHGINIKPGKPTILAVCQGKPVLGLPGNPVSALVVAGIFLPSLFNRMMKIQKTGWEGTITASLSINLVSQSGRVDYVPVKILHSGEGLTAEPIFYKSNLIFSLTQADGLAVIPADSNGLEAGSLVSVELFL